MAVTSGIKVVGLERVLKRINKMAAKIPYRTLKGMITAGLYVQGEAMKLVPVDLGNLRSSAFTVWGASSANKSGKFSGPKGSEMKQDHDQVVSEENSKMSKSIIFPSVEVGFSAYYAVFVHEDLDAAHSKGQQAKFLQTALAKNRAEIMSIIINEVRTK